MKTPGDNDVGANGRLGDATFHALLDAAVDAIVVIEPGGTIEAFNASAQRLFGYRLEQVRGRNVKMLMPAPYRDAHDSYLHNYLTTGQARIIGIGREVQAQRQDGSVFPISLAVGEARLGDRRRFVGIIRDLSERYRAERELRQAEAEAVLLRERLAHMARLTTIGEMATGIAHEINQPLTAIATYAQGCQRLLRGRYDPEELAVVLEKIETQASRASEVIQRIRGLVRQRESERVQVDCNLLVADVARLAETDARVHDLELVLELAPGLPAVTVDPIQIQQVVLNLTRNAIEAMVEQGCLHAAVHIATGAIDDTHIEIRVRDSGKGIDANQASQLFVPFMTTKPHGLGVGLAISRAIAQAHGGELNYRPNPEGGAIFSLVLPAATSE